MSVQRKFTCDGPECERHLMTHAKRPPAFITAYEIPGFSHELEVEHHFCSWDCVMKFAAGVEPTEVFERDE